MTGASENYKHRGLIPRAISHIFREISDKPDMAFTLRISYLEIYNEQMVDLLANAADDAVTTPIQVENMAIIEEKTGMWELFIWNVFKDLCSHRMIFFICTTFSS